MTTKIRWVLLFAAACSTTPAPVHVPCDSISRNMTIRHGACVVAAVAPTPAHFNQTCPTIQRLFCGPQASCPPDWAQTCDEPTPGVYTNCFYGDLGWDCVPTAANAALVSINEIETFNGMDGLAVIVEPTISASACEFQPCQ